MDVAKLLVVVWSIVFVLWLIRQFGQRLGGRD